MADRSAPPVPSRAAGAVFIGLFLTVVVAAHCGVRTNRTHGAQFGRVVILDPQEPSDIEKRAPLKPSLVMLGDSQLTMTSSPTTNEIAGEGSDSTVVEELARALDEQHPATPPRTYLRVAGPTFGPLDALLALATWLERAGPRPVPVLVGLDIVTATQPQVPSPKTVALLRHYPAETKAIMSTLATLPEGDAAVKIVSAALAAPEPPLAFVDQLEKDLSEWSRLRKYYYGEPFTTAISTNARYQKAEEPFLKSIFGRVVQPSFPSKPPPATGEARFLSTLVRFLEARRMPVVCYVQPRNPRFFPPSPTVDRLVEVLRSKAVEVGCPCIDAFHGVRNPEYFGYLGSNLDEAHLTVTGHRALSAFLLKEGEALGAWSVVDSKAEQVNP